MNPEIKQRWLTALRSGKYKQGIGRLKTRQDAGPVRHCCLGVLCDLAVEAGVVGNTLRLRMINGAEELTWRYGEEGEVNYLPPEVEKWAGLARSTAIFAPVIGEEGTVPTALSSLNDSGTTFEEIANLIEEQL